MIWEKPECSQVNGSLAKDVSTTKPGSRVKNNSGARKMLSDLRQTQKGEGRRLKWSSAKRQ